MFQLQSLKTFNDPNRISSIDIFRGLAIIGVIIFHYSANLFTPGQLGVDLFFVISGFLIGGLLLKQVRSEEKINFFKFVLQRGFKIWPSYYFYLAAGSLISIVLYSKSSLLEAGNMLALKKYLFFYVNYTGTPYYKGFHLWSLCVEEHFYILLPILLILIQRYFKSKVRLKALFICLILTIIAGVLFKVISYYFTHSKDTYAGTQYRIDALAWGVLLSLLISQNKDFIRHVKFRIAAFFAGLIILGGTISYELIYKNIFFEKIIYHSLAPLAFFLIILSVYYVDFSRLKFLRFIAYYSYNWYLWHPLFFTVVSKRLGFTIIGFIVFSVISFLFAFATTVLIEEPVIKQRKNIIKRLFKSNRSSAAVALKETTT